MMKLKSFISSIVVAALVLILPVVASASTSLSVWENAIFIDKNVLHKQVIVIVNPFESIDFGNSNFKEPFVGNSYSGTVLKHQHYIENSGPGNVGFTSNKLVKARNFTELG